MNHAESYFEDLLMRVVEGIATEDEFATFAEIIRRDAGLRRRYSREMRLHALLCCRHSSVVPGGQRLSRRPLPDVARRFAGGMRAAWRVGWKVAAAAVLLFGMTVWRAVWMRQNVGNLRPSQETAETAPVRIVRRPDTETACVEIPKMLPGTLSVSDGRLTVRLASGVELTLLGPASMEVTDCMQVRLEEGRVLADVPHWATGFTLHAPGLTAWDLGTVFGVMTMGDVSDVFVFKGMVQVTDEAGEGVGLCEAGEGARARAGRGVVKTAADWDTAKKMFASVSGNQALENPAVALSVAGRFGDLWEDRYAPRVVAKSIPGYIAAYNTKKTKSAPTVSTIWFRPSENDDWDYASNWLTEKKTWIRRVPDSKDVVGLDSSRISIESGAALSVGKDIVAKCDQLWMNDLGVKSTINVQMNGGSLLCSSSASIGKSGRSLMVLNSGSFSSPVVKVGENAGGQGIVSNKHATVWVGNYLVLGWYADSEGKLVLCGGKTCVGDQLIVGLHGKGVFDAETSFSASRFIVGCMSKGEGMARIYSGATGTVHSVCFIGGRDYSPDDQGSGTLVLKGGTLKFSQGAWSNALQIRYREKCRGELKGWGTVLEPRINANQVRMVNNGTVVADGEGVNRDLDLHYVVSVTNSIPNGASGTNGWYAVNRGRLLYPRTWINASDCSRNLGDWSCNLELKLVNSVKVVFVGATPNTFLRGGLYALDRTDIPAALPDGHPVGLWRLGLYQDNITEVPVSFKTAVVTFRYDHTHVKPTHKLKLYRYEKKEWKVVGESRPNTANCVSATEPLAGVADSGGNIGWFALIASDESGLIVTIH